MSIVRMLSRPASATLSEPVKVRTMIRPKRTSKTRSIGSNTRLEDRSKEFSGMGRWELKLLRGLQFETGAKQPADNSGRCAERRQRHQHGSHRLDPLLLLTRLADQIAFSHGLTWLLSAHALK